MKVWIKGAIDPEQDNEVNSSYYPFELIEDTAYISLSVFRDSAYWAYIRNSAGGDAYAKIKLNKKEFDRLAKILMDEEKEKQDIIVKENVESNMDGMEV